MSRIETCFSRLKAANKKALIPFVTAGDPNPEMTLPLMHAMVKAGADIIELGVPFSDPMAEGPVIQRACERALLHHTSLHDVIAMVARFREDDDTTPVVLMGYLNPVEVMGYEAFATAAAQSGVDGVITVDMPPEEAGDYGEALKKAGLDPVFLLAPTSTEERIAKISALAGGFVYYVSLKGVTGAANIDMSSVSDKLNVIRGYTEMPVAVGFGIKDAQTAAAVAAVSDAVVVGSALVRVIEDHAEHTDHAEQIIAEISQRLVAMREAIDQVD